MLIDRFPVRLCLLLALLSVVTGLSGCSTGYYWQAAAGQFRVSQAAVPVERLLQAPETDPVLQQRLRLAGEIAAFAHTELGLPDNGSYRRYLDTGSQPLVWNVYAAPEFSLEPVTWCFPVAGCVAYRGYFSVTGAERYARRLAGHGYDVWVTGIAAYSTLGYFRDPLLDTMLSAGESALAALLFHELAHQLLYVPGDTAFNEAFAVVVEREGLRRWHLSRQSESGNSATAVSSPAHRAATVRELLSSYREQLRLLYLQEQLPEQTRAGKERLLQQLADDYAQLAADGDGPLPLAELMATGLNNAGLAAVAIYDDYQPAFRQVLAQCGTELSCFYAEAAALAALDQTERSQQMQILLVEK